MVRFQFCFNLLAQQFKSVFYHGTLLFGHIVFAFGFFRIDHAMLEDNFVKIDLRFPVQMIPRPVLCLLSIFDSGSWAVIDAGHTVGAIFAPCRLAVDELYIMERTNFDAFPAGDTILRCAELIRFDKLCIKHRIDNAALKLPSQWRFCRGHLFSGAYDLTSCVNRRLCGCDDHFCLGLCGCLEHGDVSVLAFTVVGSYIASLLPSATMGGFSVFMTFLLGIKFIVQPVMTTKESMQGVSAKKRAIQSLLCGALIGFICGFGGAGGGMMLRLILTSVLGYELKTAVGTSVFIMTFTALTGAISHFKLGGMPDWTVFSLCVVFTLIWARIAALFANKADPKTLNRATGIILVILGAVVMLFSLLT